MTEEKIKITAINKIKINNDRTATINYVQQGDLASSEVVFTGKEKVTEEFYKKFQDTVETFVGIMTRLKPDQAKIKMNAIRLDYDKSNVLKSVLYIAKYAFHDANNAVMNLSTPQIPVYREGFDEHTYHVAGSDENLLYDVVELAKKYINGETGTVQGKLNLEVTEDEEG